jgi:hypothetical protein
MEKDPAPRVIAPEGKLFIDKAVEIHSLLKDALSKSANVVFNWDAVEDVDLPVLQLIYAAQKEAALKAKKFHFSGTLSDRVSARFVACGFTGDRLTIGEELGTGLVDFQEAKNAR